MSFEGNECLAIVRLYIGEGTCVDVAFDGARTNLHLDETYRVKLLCFWDFSCEHVFINFLISKNFPNIGKKIVITLLNYCINSLILPKCSLKSILFETNEFDSISISNSEKIFWSPSNLIRSVAKWRVISFLMQYSYTFLLTLFVSGSCQML